MHALAETSSHEHLATFITDRVWSPAWKKSLNSYITAALSNKYFDGPIIMYDTKYLDGPIIMYDT